MPIHRTPAVPPGWRYYAIGDIHGRADLLERLLAIIAADAEGTSLQLALVFLGDFIDRGPASAAVIERLTSGPPDRGPLAEARWLPLRGNHEDTMLAFLDDAAFGPGWFANGGLATVQSYAGTIPPEGLLRPEMIRTRLAAALPDRHRRFLADLPLSFDAGDYLFVHAGLRPGIAIPDQDPEDLLWIRDDFIRSEARFGKVVVHGHTISAEPELRPNRIGVDTGAYRSGRLTCVVLEGTDRRFLAT